MTRRNQTRRFGTSTTKYRGISLYNECSIRDAKIQERRLSQAQILGSYHYLPLVLMRAPPIEKKSKKMSFNDKKAEKYCIVRVYIDHIDDTSHPFYHKNAQFVVDKIQTELVGISQLESRAEFDVSVWEPINKNEFVQQN